MSDRYVARRIRRRLSVAGIALALLAPMVVAAASPAVAAGSWTAAVPSPTDQSPTDQSAAPAPVSPPAESPISPSAGASASPPAPPSLSPSPSLTPSTSPTATPSQSPTPTSPSPTPPSPTPSVSPTIVDPVTIAGSFRSATGAPIVGARVIAWNVDVGGRATAEALTGADGAYSLVVPAGRYRLEFVRPEGGGSQYAPGVRFLYSAGVFALTTGAAITVDEIALPTGRITGRLVDAAGNPVVGAEVVERHEDNMIRVAARTNADGRYTVAGVPAGQYRLSFRLPIGAVGEQFVPRTLDLERATRFEVRADETLTIDEQLLPTGTIIGRILDAPVDGLIGYNVQLYDVRGAWLGAVTTLPDGTFQVVVFAGGYKASFTDVPWTRTHFFAGARTLAAAAVITVAADSSVTIEGRPLPTSEVRVTARDTRTGALLDNFCAYVPESSGTNCSNGTAEVWVTGVVVGATSITTYAPNGRYNRVSVDVNVTEGIITEVVVPMTRDRDDRDRGPGRGGR